MYKNQYFISNLKLAKSHELKTISFNSLNIYSHPSLNLSTAKNQSIEVLLLGYIIDPLKPQQADDDIVRNLAQTCNTKEAFFKEIQPLSGRFVLLYKNNIDFIALNDASALRQLYYGFIDEDVIMTSSLRMFLDFYGNELEMSDLIQEFINMDEFESNESVWAGDKCIDNRLMKVLPNHFIDIANKRLHRTPIHLGELLSQKDTLEYSATVLKGSFKAITKRYQVIQPLTAAWDTRILLAASREVKDSIQFYVFDHSKQNRGNRDVWLAQRLSAKLGLTFEVVRPEELEEDFLSVYRREHVLPRILPKLEDIQYHYYNYSGGNTVRLSGLGGETLRCLYGYTNRSISARMLPYFYGYSGRSEYVTRETARWFEDAKQYCQQYSIPLLDLFYWEERMGNGDALYPFEQDIAIEEFCPLSNRNLILSILKINAKKRAFPKCAFFRRLISYLWEDALGEPINPIGYIAYLRRLAGRYTVLRYYNLRTKSIVGSRRIRH